MCVLPQLNCLICILYYIHYENPSIWGVLQHVVFNEFSFSILYMIQPSFYNCNTEISMESEDLLSSD